MYTAAGTPLTRAGLPISAGSSGSSSCLSTLIYPSGSTMARYIEANKTILQLNAAITKGALEIWLR